MTASREEFETLVRNLAPEEARAFLLKHDAEQRRALALAETYCEAFRQVLVEELRDGVAKSSQLRALRARLAEAEDLLRPFAEMAEGRDPLPAAAPRDRVLAFLDHARRIGAYLKKRDLSNKPL